MDKNRNNRVDTRKNLRKRAKILAFITSFAVIVSILAVFACIVVSLYYKNENAVLQKSLQEAQNQTDGENSSEAEEVMSGSVYNQSQVDELVELAVSDAVKDNSSAFLSTIQDRLTAGESTMTVLRDLYPENVVMVDSGQYHFLPIDNTLTRNTYQKQQFIKTENGEMIYPEGVEPSYDAADTEKLHILNMEELKNADITLKGIDVSRYQGEIDWEAVKNDGVDYAIIRIGIRGYSEGAIVEDEQYKRNIEQATANGIPVGVYFFTEAISDQEALEEAEFVIDLLKGYNITYPVYLDVEDVNSANCRTNNLTQAERTQYARTFLEAVRSAGYTPGIYGNLKSFMLMLDITQLEEYEKWFASYSMPIYYPYEYKMLQYTEKASVAGITGGVDMNISFKDYSIQE